MANPQLPRVGAITCRSLFLPKRSPSRVANGAAACAWRWRSWRRICRASPADDTTGALKAAFEQGLRERDLARAEADAAIAVHIRELMAIKQRRLKRKEAGRRRRRNDGHSLAKLLKTVRQPAITLHSAAQFQELSLAIQRELYDYCNSKLHAFLLRSLGNAYSHLLPPPEVGGPAHGDGLQACRVIKAAPHRAVDVLRGVLASRTFMKLQFASTGSRHTPENIRTYTGKLSQLSLSYKQASTLNNEISESLWMVKLRELPSSYDTMLSSLEHADAQLEAAGKQPRGRHQLIDFISAWDLFRNGLHR